MKANKKRKSASKTRRDMWILLVLAVVTIGAAFLAFPPNEKINQGLDIQGGLSVVLTAKSENGQAVSQEDMKKSRSVIESRVNALGASETTVAVQGTDQILVQIPGMSNAEEALATIGQTGVLEFIVVDEITDEQMRTEIESGKVGVELTEGSYTPIITGSDISNVTVGPASQASQYYSVNLRLNSEGSASFAKATTELAPIKGLIAIVLDGVVQSAPAVQNAITNGEVSITGNYDLESAKQLQTILESGSLPVTFEYEQSTTVGPTLGQDELAAGAFAALAGLIIVMLYLIFFYRGLGAITALNMCLFAIVYLGVLAALSAFGLFSLSLAGIAGIILTIGMAADSSILVIERFKEEIKMGRSPRAASITGVKHAITTSIDADLVTMVSALCLFFIASSSVKGFGLTLALGIICDIVIMLLFKGPIIRVLAPKVMKKHPSAWGINKALAFAEGEEPITKKKNNKDEDNTESDKMPSTDEKKGEQR